MSNATCLTQTIKLKSEKKDDEKSATTSMSPEEGSPSKDGKPKPPVDVETAKLELPTTPKSSHKAESFKRKLEADNIVVTIVHSFFSHLLHAISHDSYRVWFHQALMFFFLLGVSLHNQSTMNL